MIDERIKTQYVPTIGIECHVQLNTKTKLFAAVGNDAREAPPNSLISHICVGMPGALPVLNEKAVELAVIAAFALNTKPQKFSKFDRKHYFYPDLPKGYQITQYDQPIIKGGHVEIEAEGEKKKIGITRVHLEEDAGKTMHPEGAEYSLVDLNRAGTPLLEIVSEPDIHSAAEAKAYTRELWLLMKYAGVTDGDLYHGHVRFDVNTSVSDEVGKKGIRSEVKNLNSFRAVESAVAYEIKRQTELLEKGEKVTQETRGWDEVKQKTISQRGKEETHDYRYMPEPDIPPIELTDSGIEELKKNLPKLPEEWRRTLSDMHIDSSRLEMLLEAQVVENSVDYLSIIVKFADLSKNQKMIQTFVHWFTNIDIPLRKEQSHKKLRVDGLEDMYHSVFQKLDSGEIYSSQAKRLIVHMLENPDEIDTEVAIEKAVKELGLEQIRDESEIEKIVQKILTENQKAAEDIKNGETKAIGFLVGEVMKKSQGRANPTVAQEIIKRQLGIS